MADETTPARPANSASKAEWVAYAEAISVDASGTREEIRARVEAIEADEAAVAPSSETGDAEKAGQAAGDEQEPADEAATEESTEDTPTAAPPAAVTFPAEPVHTFTMRQAEDEPIRAGGHVLTENGWVVEATGEPVEAEASEEDGESGGDQP